MSNLLHLPLNKFREQIEAWRILGTLDRNLASGASKKGHKHRIGRHRTHSSGPSSHARSRLLIKRANRKGKKG